MKCKACGSCGMPMEKPGDYAGGDLQSLYCSYCADKTGALVVTFEEVVDQFAHDLVAKQGLDRSAARKIAARTVKSFPAWSQA